MKTNYLLWIFYFGCALATKAHQFGKISENA